MRQDMAAFASTFHYRLSIAPREKHDVFSEMLIRTLELCDLAAQLVDGEIWVEDHRGKMRHMQVWTRYFRLYMRQVGGSISPDELMEEIEEEDLPGGEDVELPDKSELRFHVGPYPDLDLDGRHIVQQALDLAQQTLGLIGINASMRYNGEDYALSEFADQVLTGNLTDNGNVSTRDD